ncbi:phage head closure protein [Halobacillus shinanisalinarum]|uniref:Phage head closure protein n=1 Tax=Halobacillus shinanisalinarum TaxID=2932258 RepID=A0ABY4H362_9BACI|nr:phage head closure protein [Halobacillus shinanisalinarum]UOQ93412.1 phage head closure protein [Halobacillus shinanisalinarum]
MNERIKIMIPGPEKDPDTGYPIPEKDRKDDLFYECWSEPSAPKGREFYEAAAVQAEQQIDHKIRWKTGITNDMYVLWHEVKYNIKAVLPDYAYKKYVILKLEVIQ